MIGPMHPVPPKQHPHRRLRLLTLVLLAGLAAIPASRAQSSRESSVVQAFRAYDLFGTWSPHCNQPPSPDNPRVVWRLQNGVILHQVSFDGTTAALTDQVGTGAAVGRDRVWFTSIRDGRFALTVTIRIVDGRIYPLKSSGPDGHVFVDHGINLATGAPTPVDEKCGVPVS